MPQTDARGDTLLLYYKCALSPHARLCGICCRLFAQMFLRRYAALADTEKEAKAQLELCRGLSLSGRILIAEEGINGTVSGPKAECERCTGCQWWRTLSRVSHQSHASALLRAGT